MKRLVVIIALFLSGILVSCGTNISPSEKIPAASTKAKKQPTSVVQPTSTKIKKQPTSTVRPSSTPHKPPPTLTPYHPPTSTADSNVVSLPYSSDVPPGDVLAQISVTGLGGGPDSCEQFCIAIDNNSIILSRYASLQQLRILVYTSFHAFSPTCSVDAAEYITEWYVTVDRNGYKYLSVSGANTNDKMFFVEDVLTGEQLAPVNIPLVDVLSDEQVKNDYCPNSSSSNISNSCPGAPSQRMIVNERGYVCTKSDNVKLREYPSRSGTEIIRLGPGTGFDVLEGPSCSDNWSWWKIRTDDGTVGWISEGGDSTDPYFICPGQ